MIKVELFMTICINYQKILKGSDTSPNIMYILYNLKFLRY